MTHDEDIIGESLGVAPARINDNAKEVTKIRRENTDIVIHKDEDSDELDRDMKYARENLYHAINSGSEALEEMLELAKSSEHPRAFEVVATLIKTIADVNKDLVDLADKKDVMKNGERSKKQEEGKGHTTNNNLYVGSTADLQAALEAMNDKKDK